jgi:putative FmdB family regulatory protein
LNDYTQAGATTNVPTYTYTCTACNDIVEKRQSFSDQPLTTCEQCGGALRKIIHPVGIVFKGSGWYITDSRSSGNGRRSSESSSPSSSSTKESSSKQSSSKEPTSKESTSKESSSSASSGTSSSPSSSKD